MKSGERLVKGKYERVQSGNDREDEKSRSYLSSCKTEPIRESRRKAKANLLTSVDGNGHERKSDAYKSNDYADAATRVVYRNARGRKM